MRGHKNIMDTSNEREIESDAADDTEQSPSESVESSRRYSSEEVAEIIRISLSDAQDQSDNTVDHQELLSIAADVGVAEEQIESAIGMLQERQATKDKEAYLWVRFKTHCILFVGFNLFFVTINLFSNPTYFWSLYTLFGWGLFLLGHYAGLRYAPQFVELAMERTRNLAASKYREMFDGIDNVRFINGDPMGLSETQGLVTLQDEKLVIEYQTTDSLLGVYKSAVKVVQIDIGELSQARLEQKLWNTKLVLHAKTMRGFQHVPGNDRGVLRLEIDRQCGRAASELVEAIRDRLGA